MHNILCKVKFIFPLFAADRLIVGFLAIDRVWVGFFIGGLFFNSSIVYRTGAFRGCVRASVVPPESVSCLTPLRGLFPLHVLPTAYAVGCILAPLRG
jgi:hypothetical protein